MLELYRVLLGVVVEGCHVTRHPFRVCLSALLKWRKPLITVTVAIEVTVMVMVEVTVEVTVMVEVTVEMS